MTALDAADAVHDAHPRWQRAIKRGIDLLLGGALLLMLSPVLLVLVCAIMVVDRHWPVYLDERVGLNGKRFRLVKLRSLRADDEVLMRHLEENEEERRLYLAERKLRHDPRRTRLGFFLRRSSLDEAPQLLNVLQGSMSIVGPRPVTFKELASRDAEARAFLRARPGLTGLWQVSGRSNLSLQERCRLDAYYARRWSLRMDLTILLRTPVAVLTGRGAF